MSAEQPNNDDREPDPDETEAGAESIELEHSPRIDTPRYVVRGSDGAWAGPAVPEPPIPESPLHLCPTCDYNLTGLKSRRCPECGEHFTLPEARNHAVANTPAMRRLYRAAALERHSGWVGLLLVLAAMALPGFVAGWASGPFSWQAGASTTTMIVFAALLMLGAWIVKAYWDPPWSQILFAMGFISILLSAAVSFF